ncbi:MAG: GNAT family N-acetyltransferase [Sporocytophaga sp.]|uniref:GNAT family N-acetyltransferase n=1 Tax=Sporocytophaga sp. TaxID=2231183 RepID=UPI001B0C94E9|nr:GNAT family N-acetyltransferase [Sporocytophaga sp.]MBO9699201.1 GNAT family N-acetyltransferase [Sporocytophaga sp.]
MLQFRDDSTFSVQNSFEGFLFNSIEQIHFQSSGYPFCSLILFDKEKSVARLRITLFISDSDATSPLKAPFGGFEFDNTIGTEDIFHFLFELEFWLLKRSIQKIHIVSYPYCYNRRHSELVTHCLLKKGFVISEHDMNFHLEISSQGDFESGLNPSARRRYRKYRDSFQFCIEDNPDIDSIYSLVKQNREIKGHPVTITPEGLKNLYQTFEKSFKTFLLKDGEKVIGSAFGVKISGQILYYYLPADSYGYKRYSPSISMIGHIYNYCRESGITLFDLGIATSKSVPNFGLIKFKQNMGGKVSLKLSFEKNLLC